MIAVAVDRVHQGHEIVDREKKTTTGIKKNLHDVAEQHVDDGARAVAELDGVLRRNERGS